MEHFWILQQLVKERTRLQESSQCWDWSVDWKLTAHTDTLQLSGSISFLQYHMTAYCKLLFTTILWVHPAPTVWPTPSTSLLSFPQLSPQNTQQQVFLCNANTNFCTRTQRIVPSLTHIRLQSVKDWLAKSCAVDPSYRILSPALYFQFWFLRLLKKKQTIFPQEQILKGSNYWQHDL